LRRIGVNQPGLRLAAVGPAVVPVMRVVRGVMLLLKAVVLMPAARVVAAEGLFVSLHAAAAAELVGVGGQRAQAQCGAKREGCDFQ
jgi:hypothetical protein